ncbi:MAG: hypothetical protein KAI88_04785 [Nitrosomonadaceae bacterium]|nr:hypothetical protein [Nitrosomonadaceae bacterium]
MARINPFIYDGGDVIDIVIMAKEKKGLHAHALILTTLLISIMSII